MALYSEENLGCLAQERVKWLTAVWVYGVHTVQLKCWQECSGAWINLPEHSTSIVSNVYLSKVKMAKGEPSRVKLLKVSSKLSFVSKLICQPNLSKI
jgi:hypothetical protein